jgi:pyruvate kinase
VLGHLSTPEERTVSVADADQREIRPVAADLLSRLERLRAEAAAEAEGLLARWRPSLEREGFAESAANFAAYLALRHRDVRPLQAELAPLGLSSLGRLEGRVLPNLDAVIATLAAVAGAEPRPCGRVPAGRGAFFRGDALLAEAADRVLGTRGDGGRRVRILVTCGREAAEDPASRARSCVAAPTRSASTAPMTTPTPGRR